MHEVSQDRLAMDPLDIEPGRERKLASNRQNAHSERVPAYSLPCEFESLAVNDHLLA